MSFPLIHDLGYLSDNISSHVLDDFLSSLNGLTAGDSWLNQEDGIHKLSHHLLLECDVSVWMKTEDFGIIFKWELVNVGLDSAYITLRRGIVVLNL